MTTTPPSSADERATLRLSRLYKRPVTDRGGESLGRLADVIVRLRGADYPLVTGLVAAVGGREIFVPIDQVSSFDGDPLRLSSARLSLRHFDRRDGEVLLRADVLGHRLIYVPSAHLIKAGDLELRRQGSEWVLAGVDTHRRARGLMRLLVPAEQAHQFEDWHNFEPLIGHASSALLRGPFGRIRRLKAAQIADCSRRRRRPRRQRSSARCTPIPSLRRTCSRNSTRIWRGGCSVRAPTRRSPRC